MNFILLIFCFMTTIIIFLGSLVNFLESKLPPFFSQIFRYGKYSAKGTKTKLAIELSKSYFKHFYVVAFLLYTYLLWLVTAVYIFNWNVPEAITDILNLVCGDERIAHTHKTNVYVAVLLISLQVYRRFYETHKISVYGDNSKINLSHYFVGMFHYPGTALAILCEAPVFASSPPELEQEPINLFSLSLCDKFIILLFLFAWKHQFTCNNILADLRKNKKGEVISSEYKLPRGDWFEYLTAPHQTAEIIMYSCIMSLLWNNITWFFVFAWVLANQIETILLTHWWYQEKFDDFPKKRKALIPFVY